MSLQLLAKQLEAKGRGGDSLLVHMTPDEVAGLQKLAESMGGSLTVNPETGLVEANFLKKVIGNKYFAPLMGIALGATGVGLPLVLAGGALAGGLNAKENDQDVLMGAGLGALGAYGGAGIGAGLASAGGAAAASGAASGAVAPGAASSVLPGATAAGTTAGQTAGQALATDATANAALSEGLKVSGAEAAQQSMAEQALANQVADQTTAEGAQRALDYQARQQMMTGYNPNATPMEMSMGPKTDIATQYGLNTGPQTPPTYSENLAQAGRGFGRLGDEAGREAFMEGIGGAEGLAKSGAAMYGSVAMNPGKLEKPEEIEEDDEMIVYDYSPGRTGAERSGGTSAEKQYFADDRFTNRRKVKAKDYFAAKGGLLSLAEGGDVAAPAALMGNGLGMSGASADAFDYLMGNSAMSPVTQSALAMQGASDNFVAPEREKGGNISKLSGYSKIAEGPYAGMYQGEAKYGFDPKAQQYYRTDKLFNYVEPEPVEQYAHQDAGGLAQGGLLALAKGGMASGGFVVPADVVSMVGEGNTDAGYRRIKSMIPGATAIKGKDGGQADTVKTHIDGKQPARVAHGEMYVPPETVKRMGGAKKLYAMMDRVRAQATGSTKQIRPVNLKKAMA